MPKKKVQLVKKTEKLKLNSPLQEQRDYGGNQLDKNNPTDEDLVKTICKKAIEEVAATFLKKEAFSHMKHIKKPFNISIKDKGYNEEIEINSVLYDGISNFVTVSYKDDNNNEKIKDIKFKDIDKKDIEKLKEYYKD